MPDSHHSLNVCPAYSCMFPFILDSHFSIKALGSLTTSWHFLRGPELTHGIWWNWYIYLHWKFHCNSAMWILDQMIADVLPALSPDSEFLPPRQRDHTVKKFRCDCMKMKVRLYFIVDWFLPPFGCYSVAKSCPIQLLSCDSLDCSTSGIPFLHYLPEFALTHVLWVDDAIQLSHPLLSPSPAFRLSQHQGGQG